MRNYLFGSGLISAVTSGIALLRGSKDAPITWRAVLTWLNWGISVALVVGTIIDMRRESRGETIAIDSPVQSQSRKRR